jgi:hypothetical protein
MILDKAQSGTNLDEKSPESLISASLLRQAVARLVADGDLVHWILLAVIHDLPIGVDL